MKKNILMFILTLSMSVFITTESVAQNNDPRQVSKKFMAKKAKEPGVKSLPSGVLYKVLKMGDGDIPKETDKVELKYDMHNIDGVLIDDSFRRGETGTLTLQADQTIKGFKDAVTNMPVGSVWDIFIPEHLAYGEREMKDIKPYSPVIFRIQLLRICTE